jgi:hypothetical protein
MMSLMFLPTSLGRSVPAQALEPLLRGLHPLSFAVRFPRSFPADRVHDP